MLEVWVLTASVRNLYKANLGRRQRSLFADEEPPYPLSEFGVLVQYFESRMSMRC